MSFVAGKSDRHCRELGPACGQALGSTAGTCTAGGLSGLQPAASPQFTHAAIFHRLDQPGVPPGAVPFHLLHHHPLPQHPGLHTGPGPQPGAPASPPHPTQHRRAASPAAAPPPAAPGGSSGRGADVCHAQAQERCGAPGRPHCTGSRGRRPAVQPILTLAAGTAPAAVGIASPCCHVSWS